MRMKAPPHPGRIVRQECLEPLNLTGTEAARLLKINRNTLSNLVNGKSGISPDMAVRLSKAFGGGTRVWLSMQMEYNLSLAEAKAPSIDVQPVPRPDDETRRADRERESNR